MSGSNTAVNGIGVLHMESEQQLLKNIEEAIEAANQGDPTGIVAVKRSKALARLRSREALGNVLTFVRGLAVSAAVKQSVIDLITVTNRFQMLFDWIDSEAGKCASLDCDRYVFQQHMLRVTEVTARMLDHQAAEAVRRSKKPPSAGLISVYFNSRNRQVLDSVNTLINQNRRRDSMGSSSLSDAEIDYMVSQLALTYDEVQTQFDAYTYWDHIVEVNNRSTVVKFPEDMKYVNAFVQAAERISSHDNFNALPLFEAVRLGLDNLPDMKRVLRCSFDEFANAEEGRAALRSLEDAGRELERIALQDIDRYFDPNTPLTTAHGTFTFSGLVTGWKLLFMLSLVVDHWNSSKTRDSFIATAVATIHRRTLSQLLTERNIPASQASALIRQFTALESGAVDLYYTPLLRSGDDTFLLASRYVLTARISRNLFKIAVRESELNQKSKGRRPLLELKRVFSGAGFACEIDIPVDRDGVRISDIDIAAYRDGVLFMGQSKIVIMADSHHDKWSVFTKLQAAGDRQLRRCLEAEPAIDPKFRQRLGISDHAVRVVPFIITNEWSFTGTDIAGFPVVDFSYLNMLLSGGGMAAALRSDDGTQFWDHKAYSGPLTADLLEQLIREPIHSRYLSRPVTFGHRAVNVGPFRLHCPTGSVSSAITPYD